MEVVASAPGKVLMTGGYLVLERPNAGLVLSTNARFYAIVKPIHNDDIPQSWAWSWMDVKLTAPQLSRETMHKMSFKNYILQCVSSSDGRNPFVEQALQYVVATAFAKVDKDNKDAVEKLLKRGLDITIMGANEFYSYRDQLATRGLALAPESLTALPPFSSITFNTDDNNAGNIKPEVAKTGLGSSAAMTTAVVAALLHYLGIVNLSGLTSLHHGGSISNKDLDLVHMIAQTSHCMAQGKVGSGFDVSCAVYGSQRYVRFSPEVLSSAQVAGIGSLRGIIREKVEKLRNDELGGVEGEDGEEMEDLTLAEIRTKALGKSKGKKEERKTKAINTEVVVHKKDERVDTMRRVVESGELEVMAVEDSDFYDFDEDRVENSFKKGQVWAIYDDSDGMPRHYGLIDDVNSVNPFAVKMSWLDFQSEWDERLMSWEKNGFHISCGKYKVARKDDINLLNIFSHVVQCERAARELYLVYPRKGSVWALYDEKTLNFEARNSPSSHLRSYDIVLCLTSYDATYGVSIAYLEKVDGYKAVFMRREIGYDAVRTLHKNEISVFSHQIPARKLSNDDVLELTNNCWELDPASLPQSLLAIK